MLNIAEKIVLIRKKVPSITHIYGYYCWFSR